jgi:peptidoglycan glycosyltransferase
MNRSLHRLALAFAAAFALLALTGGYWALLQAEALTARADNPRRALLERRFPRGAIFDRNGAVLAESVGTPGDYVRHYPYAALAPVLGYVSPFYGSAGIEAELDSVLHGDAGLSEWDRWQAGWFGPRSPGRGVQLTLDLNLQRRADDALGARAGAAILLDAASGEILVLASHPTFDPNRLEADWSALVADQAAPLLNRATLALYQPGGALAPALLAAAVQAGLARVDEAPDSGSGAVTLGAVTLQCRRAPVSGTLTYAEALRLGCPQPFAELGPRLGDRRMEQLFSDLRLLSAPAIGLPTTASAPPDYTAELRALASGQGSLTLTPLHQALVTAALAHRGELPAPQLVRAVQERDGAWQTVAPADHPVAALAPEAAGQVAGLMSAGHTAVAYSGDPARALAWFSGIARTGTATYAAVVVLEDGDTSAAARIGQALLQNLP